MVNKMGLFFCIVFRLLVSTRLRATTMVNKMGLFSVCIRMYLHMYIIVYIYIYTYVRMYVRM